MKKQTILITLMLILILLLVVILSLTLMIILSSYENKHTASVSDCSTFYRMRLNAQNINLGYGTQQGVESSITFAESLCYLDNTARGIQYSCKIIDDPSFQEVCNGYRKQYTDSLDKKLFGKITLRDLVLNPSKDLCEENTECIQMIAMLKNDEGLCEDLPSGETEKCMFSVAVYNNDPSICKELGEGEVNCLKIFNVGEKLDKEIENKELNIKPRIRGDVETCKRKGDEDEISSCILKLAIEKGEVGYCDNFPESTNTYQSNKGLCYGLLTVKTENLGYCMDLENKYYQNVCRWTYDKYFTDFEISREGFIQRYI